MYHPMRCSDLRVDSQKQRHPSGGVSVSSEMVFQLEGVELGADGKVGAGAILVGGTGLMHVFRESRLKDVLTEILLSVRSRGRRPHSLCRWSGGLVGLGDKIGSSGESEGLRTPGPGEVPAADPSEGWGILEPPRE